ncbi:hypothetical protein ACGFYQ_18790 [Streptomyces sp. NPDC048258]|uniref:hypothetical protein n=1 Tax=Streptomyces sp. NPDC048258 TaxID=3365527 RepID=UPI003712D258
MKTWTLTRLILLNRARQEGGWQFAARLVPLSLGNILLLFAIFTGASGRGPDLDALALQYGYFIPLTALSAAVGTWEVELFAGVADEYILRPARVMAARVLVGLAESLAPFALFLTVLLVVPVPDRRRHLITATLMLSVFLLLGTALGYCFGFRHEKAVNNFLASVTWVLGFGPGPFFGNEATGALLLFPGGFSLRGDFLLEWLKLGVVLVAAAALLRWGSRPRRHRSFAR